MKEFIDKLIERLEEKESQWGDTYSLSSGFDEYANGMSDGFEEAIKNVNELAEEYKDKVMIDGRYCWQTCSATEHCKECNRLCNGSIDYYENYDFMADEYKGGWISCEKELPSDREEKLVYLSSNRITIAKYNEHRLPHSNCPMGWGYDSSSGYIDFENETVVAWCKLPAPYTEGE